MKFTAEKNMMRFVTVKCETDLDFVDVDDGMIKLNGLSLGIRRRQ